ncbi:MAG: crossover junction endodeoxyribonuclease RuvC, partial [Acidobacteria bacterium]|nr:crossover junction endodeoxyribonuclease RuvC [Acidobacteriota bacterium]
QMTKLLLGLEAVPSPHDAADALAIAICHVHQVMPAGVVAAPVAAAGKGRTPRTWRQWKP